jgi:restriction system protein
MAVPKYHEFMKPILEFLSDNQPKGNLAIYEYCSNHFQLSNEQKEERNSSGSLIYRNRIGWAVLYLRNAALLQRVARATYSITEEGQNVVLENPIAINSKYLMKFEAFRTFKERAKTEDQENNLNNEESTSDDTPQDLLEKAFKEIEATTEDELITTILNNSPEFFEKLVVDLLVAMGYGGMDKGAGLVVGKSGDEGIDGIINEDKLGFNQIYIQAKRWDLSSTISRPEIQKFLGALVGKGASKGAYITTTTFSKHAKEFAEKQSTCKVILIDGVTLTKLMIEYNLGVTDEKIYKKKKIDFDYFIDE